MAHRRAVARMMLKWRHGMGKVHLHARRTHDPRQSAPSVRERCVAGCVRERGRFSVRGRCLECPRVGDICVGRAVTATYVARGRRGLPTSASRRVSRAPNIQWGEPGGASSVGWVRARSRIRRGRREPRASPDASRHAWWWVCAHPPGDKINAKNESTCTPTTIAERCERRRRLHSALGTQRIGPPPCGMLV